MQVLVAPIVSEKATMAAEKSNAVLFKVLRDATKPEIKAAVELMFKVQVKGVSVLNQKGKAKRFGKTMGRRDHVRKAYVTLKPGQELNFGGEGVTMAVIKMKPTSPGRRGMVKVTRDHLHKGEGFAPLLEPQFQKAGRNNNGHITTRHKGGGAQAPLPRGRLPPQQGRHPGQGRAHRVRPEPHGPHRAAVLRRRRAPLHHRPARC
jgi:large subunit ribosomal protein L23